MRCPRCGHENPRETRFCGHCGAALARPDDAAGLSSTEVLPIAPLRELAAGETFARRYQVIEDLGKGGMGRVYKVFDTEVREKLALKILNPEIAADEATIERFRNELKLARTISHRNICRMHDLGREESTYYITMEYVAGEDLKSFIHRVGALPVGKAVGIARQVAEGLEEAHRAGVIHRDLKPHNIMIDRDGNARIMDFGIARSVKGKGITGANVIVGTPEYMSPEQVDGKEAGPGADIYALGIVLFEMLTGRLPFEGETPLAVAVKQKSETPPDPRAMNAQVPDDLARAVLKCLDKSPAKRFASAAELLAELARIEKSLPTTTTPLAFRKPATSKQITVRLPSKKVWIPALDGLIAVAAFLLWQLIPERASAKRSIAVMGFKNQTGDAAFDYLQETIPNLLITSLEQSGHFRVTTWQRLRDLFHQAGKDQASAVLDEDAIFEICRAEGIETLAVGFFTKAGETFVTDVKVLDAATKQPLKTAQARGDGPGSILKTQIDEISRSVSRGIGLPPLKIERAQPKIADLTTNSIEAYNLFLRGRDEIERFFSADARRSLERAVELDPSFAIAWLYLSRACNELSDTKARDEALQKAKQHSAKASERERLYIAARYARGIERNSEARHRILQEFVARYPTDKYAHSELAFYDQERGLLPEAIAEYEKALALDPDFGEALNQVAYVHGKLGDMSKAVSYLERYAALSPNDPNPRDSIAELSMRMGKLDESAAKYRAILTVQPDFYLSWASLAYVSGLREDYAEMNRALKEFVVHAPTETAKAEGMWLQAFARYFLGQWDGALADFASLRGRMEKAGLDYNAATVDWIDGFILTDRGEFERARKAFDAFSAWWRKANAANPEFYPVIDSFYPAWVDLKQGRTAAARDGLTTIATRLPRVDRASREQATFLFRLLTAELDLCERPVEEAIAAAGEIPSRNFPDLRTADVAGYNQPFLKDVLARAYWKKGDLERAAAEYRKLLTVDPANQVRYLMSPLYRYRLGRVLEEKGDRAGARAEYAKFLEYWKDADPTHPELADARKRLAALK